MELPNTVDISWYPALQPVFGSDAMMSIKKQLSLTPFVPSIPDIFRVFTTPLDRIKCVIVSDTTYADSLNNGLAISIPKGTSEELVPRALEVVADELALNTLHDLALMPCDTFDESLSHLEQQGVFLLNRSLTAQVGYPDSHKHMWDGFTKYVMQVIAAKHPGMIWMIWGDTAEELSSIITQAGVRQNVLTTIHPSRESYTDRVFVGCKHFNLCNELLVEHGKHTIDWDSKSFLKQ